MTKFATLGEQEKMLCESIREAIKVKGKGKTVDEIAQSVGLTRHQLSNVMNARTRATAKVVDGLREVLELPRTWPDGEGRRVSLAGTPMVRVPVVGSVSAGVGSSNVDPDERHVYVPERLAQIGGLGWLVDGESMMPALEPGDIALFREHRTPRRGFPFLVSTVDGEMRVKIIDWEGGEWVLRSVNERYATEPLAGHQLVGFLIGWYRAVGTRETMDSDPSGLKLELKDNLRN